MRTLLSIDDGSTRGNIFQMNVSGTKLARAWKVKILSLRIFIYLRRIFHLKVNRFPLDDGDDDDDDDEDDDDDSQDLLDFFP